MTTNASRLPIAVDLDGSLLKTDCLYESFLLFLKQNPFNLFLALYWLFSKNRAYMKTHISQRVEMDVTLLPYNLELIDWLKQQKSHGRILVLATATHEKYANAVQTHLKLFDQIIATTDGHNLKGANKEARLIKEFGKNGFDYVGDHTVDLKVWRSANAAILVTNSDKLRTQAKTVTRVDKQFSLPFTKPALLKALRPHQWVKNALIFVPLFTSHTFAQLGSLSTAIIAFFSFSLCASSIYILNDFFDLEADRKHRSKKHRPFASGTLSIPAGTLLLLTCLAASFLLALLLPLKFLITLLIYLVITSVYTFYLKHLMLVDIIVLAGLFTLRIIAGAIAIDVPLSFWLLAFSIFLFLSLAIIKRYTELLALREAEPTGMTMARGYQIKDIPVLIALGSASGYISILVMALYLNSENILKLYQHPQILWLVCPALLYWIGRIWLLAHRGQINDDPIIFVVKDSTSRYIGLMIFILFLVAA